MAKLIVPRSESFSEWYSSVVLQAKMADYSPVRGCMVIRPHGYALWENMQRALNDMFKETGHVNAYFPLFIPEIVPRPRGGARRGVREGVRDRHALAPQGDGGTGRERGHPRPGIAPRRGADRPADLGDHHPLDVRQVDRVLPRPAAPPEPVGERRPLGDADADGPQDDGVPLAGGTHLARDRGRGERKRCGCSRCTGGSPRTGWRSPSSRARRRPASGSRAPSRPTASGPHEDGKALQAETSHHLGRNFAKAFDVKFQTEKGDWQHVWNSAWGVSTRLVGAIIMTDSDDEGLVLPPRLAPVQAVLVPIWKGGPEVARSRKSEGDRRALRAAGVRFQFDGGAQNPGFKFAEWELAGVPLRLELGPKDMAAGQVMAVRRQATEIRSSGSPPPRARRLPRAGRAAGSPASRAASRRRCRSRRSLRASPKSSRRSSERCSSGPAPGATRASTRWTAGTIPPGGRGGRIPDGPLVRGRGV